MSIITLTGLASKKTTLLPLNTQDLSKTLLDFLRESEIPIASSCQGQGICKMCVINNDQLSCQLTVKEFREESTSGIIAVAYL